MYQVLEDRDLREDLRERGLKWVRAFTWQRTAEQMSRLLDEVRGEAAGPSRSVAAAAVSGPPEG